MYVNAEAIAITNATAAPIPMDVSTFLDTPRNGQIPRNLDSTKLFTNTALIIIVNILIISPPNPNQ